MDCFWPYDHPVNGPVPCGRCPSCLKRRQDDWTARLTVEFKNSSSAYFVTLTYNDDNVPISTSLCPKDDLLGSTFEPFNCLCKRDVQLFFKRFRKSISPHKIRYFICGEYGPKTLRPHYHAIIFNFPSHLDLDLAQVISDSWCNPSTKASIGFTTVSPVSPSRIAYVAKYCSFNCELPLQYTRSWSRPFVLCSRSIGRSFLSDSMVDYYRQTLSTTMRISGVDRTFSLPRYYRNILFDDQMKYDIRQRTDFYRRRKEEEFLKQYPLSKYPDPFSMVRDHFMRKFRKSKKSIL